jgi:DNA-directed RNA polymerase subunit H (RpoH/RPB5)
MESKLIYLISKARQNVLELMEHNGYDTSEYNNFTKSEVNAMNSYQQLDMLLTKEDTEDNQKIQSKIYIRFALGTKSNVNPIKRMVDELFTNSDEEKEEGVVAPTLTKNDTLYIIFQSDPNQAVINMLKNIWETDGIYVVPQSLMRLQFNILKHTLVPPHRIMSVEEVEELKRTRLLKLEELPRLSRFDPVAQAICIKPGQVCEIARASRNSIVSMYYRVCVNEDFAM